MTFPARRTCAALLTATALVATACSSAQSPDGDASGMTIVTSTSVWGDVARAVVDDPAVTITPIITNDATDPHHFEPTAADMARVSKADVVVVGGGGYDAWLYENLDNPDIIHALPLTPHHHGDKPDGSEATNEHIWYDADALRDVAHGVAGAVEKHNPDATVTADALDARLDAATAKLKAMPTARIAQTEPIADYLINKTPMKEVTPTGYRRATLNETDPAAADLAAFLELINSGGLDILVYNPQTATDMTKRIRAAAEAKGVRIVEIPETPPSTVPFPDFYGQVVDRLVG
ncbi:metal ABC transporter solute-binding protein, Zn/Mn family [Corynebacterium uberis]|uniref:metal ABC transporter solute-binding protein, Zn/Mn family n=1 Tax=Corynebacterium TaxID=1716 RepID=UPI001D09D4E8|nr:MULTISPECIES: zinc ABC transporter substrate-binding protein [Corynebacterium]MCZ9309810.1 zinc ABC transporter substrate-binding protein [Corynebacterium sp. c6VSa_13]UDL73608.1 zinc ABC transporter substrate-binding protein [Corynebacterium uberis]UDL75512.1 zinc ABC transporter substrate-binding protein [Corynebacterium uberis]UDL77725.1 zinc ABC transporter substrate-binding protein [Corynebacterium uberis]UDL80009.1 zinc ABC transporter substrate-binding protein [Corynebacterium uberis